MMTRFDNTEVWRTMAMQGGLCRRGANVGNVLDLAEEQDHGGR